MASMPLTRRRRESALRRREGGFLLSHKDPEKARAYRAAYNTAHRKERLVYDAAYRAAHREERRAYRAAHQEEQRTYSVTWRRAHPEKRREKAHRHRARVRGQFIAPVDAAAIYARDRGRCHICGKHVKRADVSMDHLIPISLGGAHAPWNVSLAHLKCNLRRNNRGVAQTRLAFETTQGRAPEGGGT